MLRRLHAEQPASFAFTPANQAWAEAQMTKFPEGRQASAIIPLLWRAQEQEGWLSRPAIEHICDMLGLAHIRGLEVATFYFMFQLHPVGSVANIQICGTTSCMICGAEDLVAVCRTKIAPQPHMVSTDGKFSWEEVECLGACANAPMAQIGKDYYEDLTTERLAEIIDELSAGQVPTPGPQNGRFASEPLGGLTSLKDHGESGHTKHNASVYLATSIGDTVKRIDGTEVPLVTPWLNGGREQKTTRDDTGNEGEENSPEPSANRPADKTGIDKRDSGEVDKGRPKPSETPQSSNAPVNEITPGARPVTLDAPRDGTADDLKLIKGVGPKLEKLLNGMGFYHYDQVAAWTPEELAWVDANLEGFKGRASRDNWRSQAKLLTSRKQT